MTTTTSNIVELDALARRDMSSIKPIDDFITRELTVRSIDVTKRTVDFIASTDKIDSYGDIVEQVWKLDDFLRNPVVLFAHQSRELPIGQCVDIGVRNNSLECRIMFATAEMNPLAEQVWQLVQAKFLRAVSVGFIPGDYRFEMRDEKEVLVFSNNVLKEISVTPVPANPDALAKMKSRALAARSEATPSNDGHGAQEKDMSTATTTTPEVQKKLDDAAQAASDAQARYKDIMTKYAEAEQRATTAEAKLGIVEKTNLELNDKVKSLETSITTREKEHTLACTERDAAVTEAKEAKAAVIALEVDALVGKKIAPTEKDDFIKLRSSDPALFTSMIAKRADMNLDVRVTSEDKNAKVPESKAADEQAVDIWNNG